MKRNITYFLCFLVLFTALSYSAKGQYVVSGAAPANIKWNQINAPTGKIITPNYYTPKAAMIGSYINAIRPHATNGLSNIVSKVPVVLYPTRVQSNGMVTWAPKRMELYTTPPTASFAVPWLKQLTAHEYRHVVQMSNLNIGITKVFSYILGEQILGVVALIPPSWFFEGDATYAETAMSTFGRGMQPDFTIEYRAMLNEDKKYFNLDKWICGSLKDNIPNRYKLGYQVIRATREYYGDDYWDKIIRYTGRNPYLIISPTFAYHKYARTDTKKMMVRTFADLKDFWAKASSVPNSTSFVDTTSKSYTTYQYPTLYGTKSIISYKTDKDTPARIVALDSISKKESVLKYNSFISSRPTIKDNNIYWTEFIPSLFWEQKSSSVVYKMSLKNKGGKIEAFNKKKVLQNGDIFYVTSTDSGYAMISYDRMNDPHVLYTDTSFTEIDKLTFKGNNSSVNGLAWDDKTKKLVAILLDDEGMRLCEIDRKNRDIIDITRPSYITLDNLSASGGRLYFNSIESGKDEAHTFDLTTGIEYRITTSKYGTIMPSPTSDSSIIATTYRRNGYYISSQDYDTSSLTEVKRELLPQNTLNKPIKKWGINIDTLNFTPSDSNRYPVKKYSKFSNLYNVHSWIPMAIDINSLVDEYRFDIGVGVTAISQNLLGDMVSNIQYGWMPSERADYLKANVSYNGLPVHISLDLEYGGGKQLEYYDNVVNEVRPMGDIARKSHFRVSPMLSMPFNFSDGSNSRVLTPSIEFNYYNSLLYNDNTNKYIKGGYKLKTALTFTNYKYRTAKALSPHLGYSIRLGYSSNPVQKGFGKVLSLYGKGYLPGIFKLHTLKLEAAVQHQNTDRYNYTEKILYPMGCDYSYASKAVYSSAITYGLPLAFPDGGIPDVLYFKRISLFIFGQQAYNKTVRHGGTTKNTHPYTYGGELNMDFNVFRITVDINIGLSVYKPSDRDKVMFGVSAYFTF